VKRRLVAALACRNNGSRLFGKPMQILLGETTVLDQIITAVKTFDIIDEIVLGISEGSANAPFVEVAHTRQVSYLFGSPQDVLKRLIQCGRAGKATDVFRVTTECPWFAYDMLEDLWHRHVNEGNDITVCDRLPEGLAFEIYTLESLERSHAKGSARDRSEFCSNYARTHRDEFKVAIAFPPQELQRLDLRVTIDYPEDLVVCRAIAAAGVDVMPRVPVARIISFLDSRPDLKRLVQPYVDARPLWDQ
jgi:spore coat polysaccharide biosynthesis protein SpsF